MGQERRQHAQRLVAENRVLSPGPDKRQDHVKSALLQRQPQRLLVAHERAQTLPHGRPVTPRPRERRGTIAVQVESWLRRYGGPTVRVRSAEGGEVGLAGCLTCTKKLFSL